MRRRIAIGTGGAISLAALMIASGFIAEVFHHQPALGQPAASVGVRLYAPWKIIEWSER